MEMLSSGAIMVQYLFILEDTVKLCYFMFGLHVSALGLPDMVLLDMQFFTSVQLRGRWGTSDEYGMCTMCGE